MRLTAQQKIEIAEAIERIAFLPAQPARDLPKVRNALGLLRSLLTRYASQIDYAKERMGIASAALSELDASAQPWRDLPNVRAYLNKRRIDNGEDMVSPGFEASINKDVRMLRAALAELDAQPKAVEVPVEAPKKGCNRHVDCAEARLKNPKTECCHDDCCEDCFGS